MYEKKGLERKEKKKMGYLKEGEDSYKRETKEKRKRKSERKENKEFRVNKRKRNRTERQGER